MPWIDEEKKLATKGKRRRIKLLEDQLDDVKENLEKRVQIHKNLEKKFQREKDFKERKLDRLKKFGSPKEEKVGEISLG
ncbi:hypothetical protein AKJ36_01260 [candidate division MSBL1 archaeon SCGC-AAA259I07]|uniref:Uncharacterized protein n=1 Tax=candidate division MSBL1 archaeon SCGC-AAA259I07 TaxID=1698266 RepID=A0A133UM29_9EURY|nr:hypothetical protein AKJ36_01260 [candidate division MSBL1 archaeon SCGC-AAA259I07]